MQKIIINHKPPLGATTYKLYTKEEADKLKIKYTPWQESEPGLWALSDDGYVGKCITTRWYPDHANRRHSNMNKWVRTCYGVAYYKPGRQTQEFNACDRGATKYLKGARRKRALKIAKIYARTMDLDYSIAEVERRNPENGHMSWKRWCKSEEFKNMVGDELTKLLSEKGFSRAKTLELLSKATDMALAKGNVTSLIRIVENLLTMHGMDKPTVTKKTNLLEAVKVEGYLKAADTEESLVEFRATQIEESEVEGEPEKHDVIEVEIEEVKDE